MTPIQSTPSCPRLWPVALLSLVLLIPLQGAMVTFDITIQAGDSFAYKPDGTNLLDPGYLELGYFTGAGALDLSNPSNLYDTRWVPFASGTQLAPGEFGVSGSLDNTGIVGKQVHAWLFNAAPAGDYANNVIEHGLFTSGLSDWLIPVTNTSPILAGSDASTALLGSYTPGGGGAAKLTLAAVPELNAFTLSGFLALSFVTGQVCRRRRPLAWQG